MSQSSDQSTGSEITAILPAILTLWDVLSWIAFGELRARPDGTDAVDFTLRWGHSIARPTLEALEARAASEPFLEAEDAMGLWLAECCVVAGQSINGAPPITRPLYATTAQLFGSWKSWAERTGEFVPSQKRFSQALQGRGFVPKRQDGTGRAGFAGIEVLRDL